MRTLQELIDEVRHNTNNTDDSRHSDADLMRFFNTAQRQVQRLIFTSNPTSPLFTKDSIFTYSNSISKYSLPSDLYARGAIIGVYPITTSDVETQPIRKILEREQTTKTGYFVKDKFIHMSQGSVGTSVIQIRLNYIKRLPDFTSVDDISDLPDETEDFLTAFVERKINAVDSSTDVINSQVFTKEEKSELSELFSDTSHDVKYPVVSDETYFSY